jgi:hypothetical protein
MVDAVCTRIQPTRLMCVETRARLKVDIDTFNYLLTHLAHVHTLDLTETVVFVNDPKFGIILEIELFLHRY